MYKDIPTLSSPQKSATQFSSRFFRYYNMLTFVAFNILNDEEKVSDAVEKCRLRASQNLPSFEYEGAFRCWLVRILIDEALRILHKESGPPKIHAAQSYSPMNKVL